MKLSTEIKNVGLSELRQKLLKLKPHTGRSGYGPRSHWMTTNDDNLLVGKRVVAVYLEYQGHAIRFYTDDGLQVDAQVEADCCSRTWIESVDAPECLLGVVQSVECVDMPDLGDLPDCEVVRYYGCKITTNRGSCVIDYRNDSNGYYGGSLCWPRKDGSQGYVYTGVHGQCEPTDKWVRLIGPKEQVR